MSSIEKQKWEKEAASNMIKYNDAKYRWLSDGRVGPEPKIPVGAYFLWTQWLVKTGRVVLQCSQGGLPEPRAPLA